MANNPSDNNQNPQDRKDKANVNDPKRDQMNDGGRDQQQGEQGKQGQHGQNDRPQQQRPDDKREDRKPQQS